jgi:hypothetical protein
MAEDKRASCVVCGGPLRGRQTRFSSETCRKAYKRQQTRLSRPPRDHVCRCETCGREMRVGRPPIQDPQIASAPRIAQPRLPACGYRTNFVRAAIE